MGVPCAARWLLSWIADPELGLDEIDQREWERKNLFLIPRTSAARGKSASTGTAAVAAVAATSGKATLVAGGRHHSQHHNHPGRSTSLPSYVNRLSSAKAAVRPQPPGSYGSYGRIGKSLVPALEPPIERQEEEDAAAAQEDGNGSNRGIKRARSAKAEVAVPKRRSMDRLPLPRTPPVHTAHTGNAPRTVSSGLQRQQPPPVTSRHQPTRPPRQPQQLPPWQRSDSFTADVADLSEAAFAHSPASGLHTTPAASQAAGPSSDSDMSSDDSGEQAHLQQRLQQCPPLLLPGQLAPRTALSRSAAGARSFPGAGAGAQGGTVRSKQLQLQPGSPPAPCGAALSELLDESVRELGGLSLLARQSAPAALQTGCAATVAALNESLSASCLQCMNENGTDGGDDTAAGAAHGGVPALKTMLSAASLRLAAPAAPLRC